MMTTMKAKELAMLILAIVLTILFALYVRKDTN